MNRRQLAAPIEWSGDGANPHVREVRPTQRPFARTVPDWLAEYRRALMDAETEAEGREQCLDAAVLFAFWWDHHGPGQTSDRSCQPSDLTPAGLALFARAVADGRPFDPERGNRTLEALAPLAEWARARGDLPAGPLPTEATWVRVGEDPARRAGWQGPTPSWRRRREPVFRIARGLLMTMMPTHQSTVVHCLRTAELARMLAGGLGLTQSAAELVELGGLLHDIGKLSIAPAILDKPADLTFDEYEQIKEHPKTGEHVLAFVHLPAYDTLADVVRHHHERLDGSGYPDGLRGEQVSLFARIVAVADVYEAMASDRPYRAGMSPAESLRLVAAEAEGGRLDRTVVGALRWLRECGRLPSA